MKLLALSDLHGDYSKIDAIRQQAGTVDAVLMAGDITNFGPDHKANECIDMFDVPVLAVPGNCDQPTLLNCLDESHAINIHKECCTIGDIDFVGLGGSNATPFHTPFELTDDDIEHSLEELLSNSSNNLKVLLSHAPPHGHVDEVPSGHVGSDAIARFIDHFSLIVCGHIHEARGITTTGTTTIVNVGEASRGHGALITINSEIYVELIEV